MKKIRMTVFAPLFFLLEIPHNSCTVPKDTAAFAVRTNIIAWISKNDWDEAVHHVRQHAELISELSPSWYRLKAGGDLEPMPESRVNDPQLRSVANANAIRLMPLITNVFSEGSRPAHVLFILENSARMRAHASALVSLVERHGYDGCDMDYEGLLPSQLSGFATLVEVVADTFHAHNKLLAVSVESHRTGTVQGAWQRIGAAADEVRLMLYGIRRARPGPTIELSWMDTMVRKFLSAVPEKKAIAGIALYGYRWRAAGYSTATWKTCVNATETTDIHRDKATDMPWYIRETDTVWYEDARSIKKKIDLCRQYGIATYAFWRLGGEDPTLWDEFRVIH